MATTVAMGKAVSMNDEATTNRAVRQRARWACVLVGGLALWGCEEGEVKSALEPIKPRCDAAKTGEEWDGCVRDLGAVADKHPENNTAQCTYHSYASKALQACETRASSQIVSDPNGEGIQKTIEQCDQLFQGAKAGCERCRDLGGSKLEGTPTCDGAQTDLKESWKQAKEKKKQEEELEEDKKKALAFCTGERAEQAICQPKKAGARALATFKVKFETTKGVLVLEAHRAWAPQGVDRFYNLVKMGYYTDVALFRVVEGFMVQFGLHGAPPVTKAWKEAPIRDDKPKESNTRGMVSYAKGGPHSRTVQLFINFVDNSKALDQQGFAPIAKVVEGMDVVDSFYKEYKETPQRQQKEIVEQVNAFLKKRYPKLDYIKSAKIL